MPIKSESGSAAALTESGSAPALELRYRTALNGVPPRPIKLAVPGWGGDSREHGDGASPMPWHCQPFVDGSTYGLELLYPYQNETRVTRDEDGIHFEADFTPELGDDAGLHNPLDRLTPEHYGLASCVDLLPPPGYCLRIEPHPRYFTDTAGDVPLAIPGHLQRFWPRTFFVVFKAPPIGGTHIFRPGEPYAQVLLVPSAVRYRISEMDAEMADDRATQDVTIGRFRFLLAKHVWKSEFGNWFDDIYRQIARRHRTSGDDGVREWLLAVAERAGFRKS